MLVTLARHAMATRFELALHGEDPAALRAAGEEALVEVERLEAQLSLFRTSSEIAHVNARAAREPVRVTPPVFALLRLAQRLHAESAGAFDITIAPLVRCWGFMDGTGRIPAPSELAAARACVGMGLVQLDPATCTVRFARPGVMIDLGAIGKGYAVEQAAEILREAGVATALLHGGTSTVYGLGAPPGETAWRVAVQNPRNDPAAAPFATVALRDEAMSVSAVWGKSFQAGETSYGHVIDPRSGEPVRTALLSAVVLPSATETDALSTALLTLGPPGHEQITALRPGMRSLVVAQAGESFEVRAAGIEIPRL